MKVEVLRVRHRGEGGFAVLEVREEGGVEFAAVGACEGLAGLRPGQRVELHGDFEQHPEHGERFRVEELELPGPGDRAALDAPSGARGWLTPAELAARPGALDPPRQVARGLAWAGRLVLLSAPSKSGKSTLAGAAAAAVSAGSDWLGRPVLAGRVAWLGLEEHPADALARLEDFGADLGRVVLPDPELTFGDPLELLAAVPDLRPAPELVVVDSLTRLAGGAVPDFYSAGAWQPILDALLRVSRGGPGVLVLHHSRKSDGEARDSSAIPAAADVALTMREDGADPAVRHLVGRGRWPLEPLSVALGAEGFRVVDPAGAGAAEGASGLEARVLAHLAGHPEGRSGRQVRGAVEGRAASVSAALAGLEAAGRAARGADGLWRPAPRAVDAGGGEAVRVPVVVPDRRGVAS